MKNSHSEIKISPKTWEKNLKSNLKKEWYGYYYFYSTKYPLGKVIKFKGMNRIKNLEDRQNLTKYLINNEIDMLSRGYNPVTKEFETSDNFITEHTPFLKALEIAKTKIKVASSTMEGIEYSLRLIKKATEKTGTSILEIGKVRKRDIRLILDTLLEMNYSNDRYNKVKANLGIKKQ